ncbi:MAG: hypothetical protein JWP82_1007 [Humibacillus sp.]|nr:hypothetical protein [Humibacillus sp.]
MAVTPTTRLGCGRDVEEVWAHVDEPPTPHEQACPDCTRVRADLAELSSATEDLRDADRHDPELRVPEGVLTDLLAIVRTEVRRGRLLPLEGAGGDGAEPSLTVSDHVVAAVVRDCCDREADVEARRVTVEAAGGDLPPERGSTETEVTVRLKVSVRHTAVVPQVAASLRDAIRHAISTRVGVSAPRVDITVEDVHDE